MGDVMSEYHYECIGGPKNGERYATKPGQTFFKCIEMPPPICTPYESGKTPKNHEFITHNYYLKLLDNGRLAWVYQE